MEREKKQQQQQYRSVSFGDEKLSGFLVIGFSSSGVTNHRVLGDPQRAECAVVDGHMA